MLCLRVSLPYKTKGFRGLDYILHRCKKLKKTNVYALKTLFLRRRELAAFLAFFDVGVLLILEQHKDNLQHGALITVSAMPNLHRR